MRVKATLTIDVWVDGAENEKEVYDQLVWAADHMASQGMLTGEGSSIVDTWKYEVKAEQVRTPSDPEPFGGFDQKSKPHCGNSENKCERGIYCNCLCKECW